MSTAVPSTLLAALLAVGAASCGARDHAAPSTTNAATSPLSGASDPGAQDEPDPPSDSVRDDIAQGRRALHLGRYREASAWFDRALEADPRAVDALVGRSISNLAQARHNAALDDAVLAAELASDDAGALHLAHVQVRVGLADAALPELRRLADADGRDAAIGHLLMIALTEAGESAEAARTATRFGLERSVDAGVLNDVGVTFERAGRLEDARDAYDRALGADPDHAPAWRNLGMLAVRLDDPDDAIRALERYLAICPDDAIDRTVVQGRIDALRAR